MRTLILFLALLASIGARAGEMTAGVGHFQIPTAPAAGTSVTSGAANVYTTNAVQLIASTSSAIYITGIYAEEAAVSSATYKSVQLMIGAGGSETVIGQYLIAPSTGSTVTRTYRNIFPPIPVANATRIAVKTADSAGALATLISLEVIAQTNVVDDAVAQSANVKQWNSVTVATPATAGIPDVNVKNINNVAAATPGASGGVLISGTNSGTTTLGALTVTGATTHTGNVVLSDGLTISAPSTLNRAGLDVAGNGTGAAFKMTAGATGNGMTLIGGATSGDGLNATVTSGHGFNITATGTAKNALNLTGAAASVANAGGSGIVATGGAASTTGGGTSGTGATITGGAGAASTNGAAVGLIAQGGGTTTVSGNDGAQITGTSNGHGLTLTHAGTGKDFNATTTPLVLAKTTNLTGLNDIAATAVVSSGAITTSGGAVSTVTTVTNQLTAAQIATGVWQDTTAGDFTTALSVGKSVMNGVALGTGLTVASVSGSVGSVTGLTASNLDTTVSSRMATYTQPTGFLAATFPSSVASPTNITAGTITTTTNLTNAPTSGDFTATMKTSLNAATPASVTGSVGSVAAGGITDASYAAGTGKKVVRASTAAAGAASTITLDASASATDSIYNGDLIYLTGGAGAGQSRTITGYVGSTQVATVDRAWQTNPDVTSTFAIIPSDGAKVDGSLQVTAASVQGNVTGSVASLTTNNDKTGYALTAAYDPAKTASQAGDAMGLTVAGVQAIWDRLTSNFSTTGSAGKLLVDNLNATVSSRLPTSSYTAPDNASVTAIKAKTDSLTFTVPSSLDVNAHHVNDTRLKGNGSTTPWGPQ